MDKLKLVATKISPDWFERLETLIAETGLTQSAILRDAIGQYLGIDKVNLVSPVNELRSEIEDLKARMTAIEGLTQLDNVNPVKTVKLSPRPTSSIKVSPPSTGALTTGELFAALEGKGYARSLGTLRRALRGAIDVGMLPDDLIGLGVTADFETRRSASPKDNSTRWLFLDRPS